MSHLPRLLIPLLALIALAGCAVNPVTGQRELSLVSADQEVAIGASNYAPSQQSQGGRYTLDPDIGPYVAGIGQKLAAVSDRPGLPYQFTVLNNPVPNAWALPGGKIAINTGLLWHLEDEAQLAAVLAHEIVHAAARHGASQMSRGMLVGAGAQILGAVAQNAGVGGVGGLTQLGAAAWMASYGRDDELESDAYGMEYMRRAGYDPQAAVELQQTFVRLNENRQPDFISGLFASHPPSQERVARNRDKAITLPAGGVRNRDIYRRNIAQLLKDKPAYEAQIEAIKALNNDNPDQALTLLDKAIKIQPREAHFYELRGHALQMKDQPTPAERAFTHAIERNPDHFSAYLARGVLHYRQKRYEAAREDLEHSHRLLPTAPASFYLGELASERGDTNAAVGYYQQAAQSDSDIGKAARQRLVLLELARSPEKYIVSRTGVSDDGYLLIAVQNTTNITVTGVRLQVTEVLGGFVAGGGAELAGPRQLGPGEQTVIKTGIRPTGQNYRVQVIAATPRQ